ncbi:MAG: hypothetical protein IKO88_06905, partial [Bacteroidales bacterium]|nr:hypothetical protein [Bacteroidales bacterium]
MNKRLTISVLAALLCAVLPAQELPRAEIAQQPPCVHVDRAGLHFPGSRDAQDHFYGLLDSLMAGSGRSVNIWHVGGSHVQAGHFSYRLQERLTTMADSLKGERGFIFPYRIAKTNSDKSFRTSFTGEWLSAMAASTHKDLNPRFGIMGIAAQTSDSLATVGIGLNISADTLWRFNRFRILGYASSPDVRPYLVSGTDTLDFVIDQETHSYLFDLPAETDTVTIGFHIPQGQSFTLTGTEPISGRKGINYYCSGVNGARLTTWLEQCPDLPRDLQLVKPDLAIFAVGINDSACKAVDFKPEVFKENYRRLIRLIREQSPDCAFVFITNNDSYRYISRGMTYNHNGPTVQKAMFELAKEYGAAVWDV